MTPSKWYVYFFREINFFFGIYFSVKLSYNSFQANIADLYFKNSLNTRLSLVYVETWQDADQTPGFSRQRYNDIFLNMFVRYFHEFFLLFSGILPKLCELLVITLDESCTQWIRTQRNC